MRLGTAYKNCCMLQLKLHDNESKIIKKGSTKCKNKSALCSRSAVTNRRRNSEQKTLWPLQSQNCFKHPTFLILKLDPTQPLSATVTSVISWPHSFKVVRKHYSITENTHSISYHYSKDAAFFPSNLYFCFQANVWCEEGDDRQHHTSATRSFPSDVSLHILLR